MTFGSSFFLAPPWGDMAITFISTGCSKRAQKTTEEMDVHDLGTLPLGRTSCDAFPSLLFVHRRQWDPRKTMEGSSMNSLPSLYRSPGMSKVSRTTAARGNSSCTKTSYLGAIGDPRYFSMPSMALKSDARSAPRSAAWR